MKTTKNKLNHEYKVVESELLLQIKKANKTHPKNETYDYIIAKYLNESNGDIPLDGLSIRKIENFIGMRISDVELCNKLLFYWITFYNKNERVMKARNIIELVESPSDELIKLNEESLIKQTFQLNMLINLISTTNESN